MSTNESRPNGYKTLLRIGQVSLVSAALGVGYLSFSQDSHRDATQRSFEVARTAHAETTNALGNLVSNLPSSLTEDEINQILAAAEREAVKLEQRARSFALPATPWGGYLYPVLSLALVGALLGLALLARRLEHQIGLTDRRMQGRVEVVEALRDYLRGDEKIGAVDEALKRLEDLKGAAAIDPRVSRTFVALRSLKEEVESLVGEAESLRDGLVNEQSAAVEAREAQRNEARRLFEALTRAQEQATGAQSALTEDLLSKIHEADRRAAALSSEAASARGRIMDLEARLKCVTSRLSKSLDLNEKTVALANEAQAQVAQLAASTTRIGERAGIIRNVVSRTDMLSLNASIEAVKAGPAGKGFTVVAEEVKSVVEQISEQLAFVTQETNDVDGSTDRTAAVISQVVAMTDDIKALMEESQASHSAVEESHEGEGVQGEASDLQQAVTEIRQGREDFQAALKILSDVARDLEAVAERKPG